MAILQLTGLSSSHLAHAQVGFDTYEKGEKVHGGHDYTVLLPGVGTDTGNEIYHGNTDSDAHWIAIHNCGTAGDETISIQARTIGQGDDLSTTGILAQATSASYVEIGAGDIIYGKFDRVFILKTDGSAYRDRIRLVRGAQYGT